jgi:hypothetical protein
MPKSAFPLSKSDSYRLTGAWRWRVLRVSAEGVSFRLLVAFVPSKRQYQAWLGAEFGADQAVVARVEFHATHHGWHCHYRVGTLVDVTRGVVKDFRPRERVRHCPAPMDFHQGNAMHIALRVFNVTTVPEGVLL